MNIKKQNNSKASKYTGGSMDLNTLTILCRYIISPPGLVKIAHISNLKNLIYSLDPNSYKNDIEKLRRVQFIKRGIDARLGYNMSDTMVVISHILKGLDFDPDFVDVSNIANPSSALSADEIAWVNKDVIEDSAKYNFMESYADEFLDICTRIKTTDYGHRGGLAHEFEGLIDRTKNDFRSVTKDDSITGLEFSLAPKQFEEGMKEIHSILSSPSRRLLTGMQGFNSITGGGVEASRVYCLLGLTGGGKSMTLLNLALQIKKYNKHYKLKDPSKIPVVVYFTMENSVVETVARLFAMTIGPEVSMTNMSVEEAMQKMRTEGQLTVSDNDPIDLFIKYKPNMSVDTTYLYTLYDDLHDRGYEPICFIQDHLMRIRSVNQTGETRFDLGSVVNEFKTFATEKDIPFLTNFHLNREAMKVVETYQHKVSNIDITQRLGKSNISESVQVLNNLDMAIIINKILDAQENTWMSFKAVKMRDNPQFEYFVQPYVYGNAIKLVEDFGGPPMYKMSLSANAEIKKIDNIRTTSANIMNNINDITEQEPIDNSLMNTASSFTFSNDNSYIINDGPNIEEVSDINDEISIMKKPPISNPIIYYNNTEEVISPQEQILNLESLHELTDLLGANRPNALQLKHPIYTDPTRFIWDDISTRIINAVAD